MQSEPSQVALIWKRKGVRSTNLDKLLIRWTAHTRESSGEADRSPSEELKMDPINGLYEVAQQESLAAILDRLTLEESVVMVKYCTVPSR